MEKATETRKKIITSLNLYFADQKLIFEDVSVVVPYKILILKMPYIIYHEIYTWKIDI